MPFRALAAVFAVLLAPAVLAQTPAAKPAPVAKLSAGECEVWARELSFAQALADHDTAAFAAHIETDAAFGSSQAEPTRGRDVIATQWAGLIEGKRIRLAWYPTRTTISPAVPDIAWSSGPALFEDLAAGTGPRYRLSQFRSLWHRGGDGVWRVLFDDGTVPVAANEAEVATFRSGRRSACPRA